MSDQNQDQNIALRLNDIEKAFSQGKGKLHVLKGASLEIKQGEMVALVGPSGSGKSTLLEYCRSS